MLYTITIYSFAYTTIIQVSIYLKWVNKKVGQHHTLTIKSPQSINFYLFFFVVVVVAVVVVVVVVVVAVVVVTVVVTVVVAVVVAVVAVMYS